VTISSVLGYLGAAQLSAYTGSKSALLAYHSSLAAEVADFPNIKTILVATGQLTTDMFDGVEQNAIRRFFGPLVEVQELAVKIVKMINSGKGGVIAEPAYARWIPWTGVMPVGVQKVLRSLAGLDTAMRTFRHGDASMSKEKS
jgi:short-subunit dehydrogenase